MFDGEGIDAASGKAASAVGGETRFAFLIENGFGHDGTGGIAGAKKQDVVAHAAVSAQID